MGITFTHKGDFSETLGFLKRNRRLTLGMLAKYGAEGVAALQAATPVDSGKTRDSWYYVITRSENQIRLQFCNSNIVNYVPIAIILQYGHATGTGGWVEGRDYINPAIQPIFDRIAENAWEEVKSK